MKCDAGTCEPLQVTFMLVTETRTHFTERHMMTNGTPRQEIAVTDIDMPFGSMIKFMVKWAIASIPALIILMVLGAVAWAVLLGFFGSLAHH